MFTHARYRMLPSQQRESAWLGAPRWTFTLPPQVYFTLYIKQTRLSGAFHYKPPQNGASVVTDLTDSASAFQTVPPAISVWRLTACYRRPPIHAATPPVACLPSPATSQLFVLSLLCPLRRLAVTLSVVAQSAGTHQAVCGCLDFKWLSGHRRHDRYHHTSASPPPHRYRRLSCCQLLLLLRPAVLRPYPRVSTASVLLLRTGHPRQRQLQLQERTSASPRTAASPASPLIALFMVFCCSHHYQSL